MDCSFHDFECSVLLQALIEWMSYKNPFPVVYYSKYNIEITIPIVLVGFKGNINEKNNSIHLCNCSDLFHISRAIAKFLVTLCSNPSVSLCF